MMGAHNYLSDWIVQRIFKNVKHEHDRFLKNLEILNFTGVEFGENWKILVCYNENMNENDETREETLQDSGEETLQDGREEAPAPQPTNYLMAGIITCVAVAATVLIRYAKYKARTKGM